MRRRGPARSWRRVSTAVAAFALAPTVLSATPTAAAAPSRYEAEGATISQGVVEANHAGFSGTGFVNLDNVAGSSVEFGVNAPTAGDGTLSIRFANGTTVDRPMDIAVNGSPVIAAQSFPGTGAWTTWQTVTIATPLQAGANTVRLTSTSANGGPNLDALDVEVAATTEYQAENAAIAQGVVESNHAGYTGAGFVNMDNVAGSSVAFTVNAHTAGPAGLTLRYANGTTADRPMDITVNGTVVAAARSFPGTGAWTTWDEDTLNATLTAGANTVRFTSTTANGGPNLDVLRVGAPADTEHPTAPGQPACADISFDSLTLSWPASTDDVAVVAYDIYFLGQKVAETPRSPFRVTGLAPNVEYRFSVFGRDAAGNESDSSPEVGCTTTADPDDPTPPSTPGRPTVSAVGQTSATVTWTASTDNRGVVRYDIGVPRMSKELVAV